MDNVVIFYVDSNLIASSVPTARYDVFEHNHIILNFVVRSIRWPVNMIADLLACVVMSMSSCHYLN